jgi:hypothetical protein
MRQLDFGFVLISFMQANFFQVNCFLWQWTHFFAYNAIFMISPGDTPVLVYVGFPNDSLLFLLEYKRRDSLDRADLAAFITRVIAITNPRYELRCPETGNAGIEGSRL